MKHIVPSSSAKGAITYHAKIYQRIKFNGMTLPDSPQISSASIKAMYMHIENKRSYISVVIKKILLMIDIR